MKKLLLITTGGAAILALIFAIWSPFGNSEHVAIYKPRSAQAHMQYGAQGAMEVQHQMKKNYFTGQIEVDDILGTRKALKRYSDKKGRDNDMEWGSLGPDNIGGRTRAIWIDPQDDNHLIGGAITGGLWQSFNAGNTWEPIESFNKHEDFYQHMMVASIARTGSGIYYIGTGTQHEGANVSGAGTIGFVGGGLWRSTNTQGTDWEQVFAPSPFEPGDPWTTVDAIVVDPNNNEKLWIAHNNGLDVYIHGNENVEFPRPPGLPTTTVSCEDVHVSADGEVIVASIFNRGYISTDGGASFASISGTLANGGDNILGQSSSNTRIEFAIAPSSSDYIYAAVVNENGSLRGVVATFDKGANWYRIALDVNTSSATPFQPFGGVGGQGNWDCAIVVNPLNPKQIFLGGLVIYSHTISGNTPALANWEQRSIYSTNYLNPFAVHPDIHFFAWDSNNIFYAATDGGFFKSNNMATASSPTFYTANQGFVTTQFYGIAHSNDERTLGGTQDNGTLYQNQQGVNPNSGIEAFGGDGFDCDISFIRPNLLFGTSQFGTILRSNNGGFGENISPTIGGSGDFTTNIRLIETENDPFSRRGTMFGVDTLHSVFVDDYQEWENGDITLGFIPSGYWIMHNSDADQRELWTQTEENLYYYSRKIERDTILIPDIDTTDIIVDITVIDSLVFPVDTMITQDCDTLSLPVDTTYTYQCDTLSFPMDTTYVDSCTIFLGEEFCVHVDTLLNNYQDSLYCDLDIILDTTVVFMDSVFCLPPDTLITYETEYTYDTTYTYITEEIFVEFIERDTLFNVSDSLLLVDPVQSLFVVGNGLGGGIWVTRDALNTSIDPEYWNVSSMSDLVNCLEWSPDRNHLYIGTIGGRLERISGFNKVYHAADIDSLTTQVLISGGPSISDIAVDYSQGTGAPNEEPASEMVVVTKATYGTQDKVMLSMNAASATSSNSFSNIWDIESPLDKMPVYSCVINKEDPSEILVGTEVGVFRTTDGGQNWVEENGGMMDRVPVLDLRQQYREAWEVENSGVIYAGTHGRGIFKNEDYLSPNTGIDDIPGQQTNSESLSNLMIFPNPMNTSGWVEFNLNQSGDVRANIFNINGKLISEFSRDNMPVGEHQINFDVTKFSAGTYVLVLKAGNTVKSGRFIVTK